MYKYTTNTKQQHHIIPSSQYFPILFGNEAIQRFRIFAMLHSFSVCSIAKNAFSVYTDRRDLRLMMGHAVHCIYILLSQWLLLFREISYIRWLMGAKKDVFTKMTATATHTTMSQCAKDEDENEEKQVEKMRNRNIVFNVYIRREEMLEWTKYCFWCVLFLSPSS